MICINLLTSSNSYGVWGGGGWLLQAPNWEFVGKDPKDFGQNSIQMQENVAQFSTFLD